MHDCLVYRPPHEYILAPLVGRVNSVYVTVPTDLRLAKGTVQRRPTTNTARMQNTDPIALFM
jgi:hypothetical protein